MTINDDRKTQGEQAQQVPGSADHEPQPATEEGKALHGDKARGEVFEQPDVVTLDGSTRIAEPVLGDETDDDAQHR